MALKLYLGGMPALFPRTCLYLAFVLFTLFAPAQTAAQELDEQDGFLVVRINGSPVRLETFVAKMKNRGPASQKLPIALITHGKPPSNGRMGDMRARLYAMHARDFARRGYLAVVVMRRGFGRSDGPLPLPVSCGPKTFGDHFEATADDIEATLVALAAREDADADRVVAIGASAGGAAVLTLAARNPRGLRGVISVSGGLRIEDCGKPELLVEPLATSGARATVKTLWIYAENDRTFPPAIVDRMHEAWLSRGGDVRRVRVPAQGEDGHTMFNTLLGRRAWLAEADTFLRDIGLPTWSQTDVRAMAQKLGLPPAQAGVIERYLFSPGEKAMARAPQSNRVFFQFGAPSMAEARQRALASCQNRPPKENCEIVAENNEYATGDGERLLFGSR